MKTVLVAFDGSDSAERALVRAADLTEAFRATLVVTSVAVVPIPQSGMEAALLATPAHLAAEAVDELALAETQLERARALLATRRIEVEFVPEVGAPAERIVELAETRQVDLIVVGTGEPGFLERLLQGSVSREVSRSTHRDVMIVH